MMLVDCPACGTRVAAGESCPACGTLTPLPRTGPPAETSSWPSDTGTTGYRSQWELIQSKLEQVAAPRYRVRGILGYGGMAGVYLADEPRLGRQVAIKVMAPSLMVDPSMVERFRQEARTIAQLDHPNIVTVYEVDDREGLHYFTMTFVAGRTLGQVLADPTMRIPIASVAAILYQVGDALAYAHERGVVHRDVKPGNVLLDQRGNAMVTDFGIAKIADADSGLTRTGILVGTPAYMSPEQCTSERVTGASDQYSLGAVIYQMLTGRPPFEGATLAVLQAHVTAPPTPIHELRPDCPEELAAAVERMLLKRPEDRWPTMSAAVAAARATSPGMEIRDELSLLAAAPASIEIAPAYDVLHEGSDEPIAATVFDARGRPLPGRQVAWSSSDPAVASVSEGRLHAVGPGQAWIAASAGSVHRSLSVIVEEDLIPSVTVQPATLSMAIGERVTLQAVVSDWDGTPLEQRTVRWSTSDPGVARVHPDGTVEAVGNGEVLVTASSGGTYAAANVTVGRPSVTSAPVVTSPSVVAPPPDRVTPPPVAGRRRRSACAGDRPLPSAPPVPAADDAPVGAPVGAPVADPGDAAPSPSPGRPPPLRPRGAPPAPGPTRRPAWANVRVLGGAGVVLGVALVALFAIRNGGSTAPGPVPQARPAVPAERSPDSAREGATGVAYGSQPPVAGAPENRFGAAPRRGT